MLLFDRIMLLSLLRTRYNKGKETDTIVSEKMQEVA